MNRWKQCIVFILGLLLATALALPFYQADSNSLVPPLPDMGMDAKKVQSTNSTNGIHILVVGDTGAGTTAQAQIASLLLAHQKASGSTTFIHLGDLIYPRGDFTRTGNALYTKYYQPLEDAGMKLYPVLGNHDVVDGFNPKALDFYQIPNRYYQFSLSKGKTTIDCFGIDTNIFNDTAQQQWLNQALKQSQAQWKIVYGHHPMVSSGQHGDNATLNKYLKPLLAKYQVDLYLAGHEHDYERFNPINGTVHIVSGGGGAYLRKFKRQALQSAARISTHHFLHLMVNQDTLAGKAIDHTGKVIDQFSIQHKAN